jgi:3-oxoacyl-[acyl-carrier protein] reductase
MNLNFIDKNALVCGSTAGIGKSTAMLLAKLGATVTLLARDEEKLKNTLLELPFQDGQKHNYIVADFNNPELLKERVNQVTENKIFHILLNNTGGPKGGPIFSAEPSEFTSAFTQHLICNQITGG